MCVCARKASQGLLGGHGRMEVSLPVSHLRGHVSTLDTVQCRMEPRCMTVSSLQASGAGIMEADDL